MNRYRVTTPNTPRVSGCLYADFAQGIDCDTLGDAGHAMRSHDFENCTLHRFNSASRHWTILMDTTGSFLARLPGVVLWHNVLAEWG